MKQSNMIKLQYVLVALLTVIALVLAVMGCVEVLGENHYTQTGRAVFTLDEETAQEVDESFEELEIVPVTYTSGDYECTVEYTQTQWEALSEGHTINGYVYQDEQGNTLCFDHAPTDLELQDAAKGLSIDLHSGYFGSAMALALLAISLLIITVYNRYFTAYEKWWFILIMAAAAAVSILVPEEDCNGVNGLIIMALYLADTFLNILCELLISKQSKWNFIVSVFVEITEIAICLVLSYRFATMATTLFFWLPIDIISFINWHRHPDREEEDLTKVRKLSGWMEVAIIAGIVIWTVVVGNFLSGLDIATDLFGGNRTLANITCYLDAMASAVGICNGVFILFRIREQWIAWYICSILEAVINILAGQYVLLVLKVGYLTNTTYGYVKWTKYIRQHKEVMEEKTLF